jgi:hypothetical protein
MVSEYRSVGHTQNAVLPGAFTDRAAPADPPKCRAFRVSWSADEPRVTMRIPSRCLNGGDYGAIRFAVLTERRSDTDWAPERPHGDVGPSPWVPRG